MAYLHDAFTGAYHYLDNQQDLQYLLSLLFLVSLSLSNFDERFQLVELFSCFLSLNYDIL